MHGLLVHADPYQCILYRAATEPRLSMRGLLSLGTLNQPKYLDTNMVLLRGPIPRSKLWSHMRLHMCMWSPDHAALHKFGYYMLSYWTWATKPVNLAICGQTCGSINIVQRDLLVIMEPNTCPSYVLYGWSMFKLMVKLSMFQLYYNFHYYYQVLNNKH